MIIINGKMYQGNVTVVNGKVIGGNSCNDLASKKFDETKKESANGVNRITINSNINVKVSACNTNDVTAHLHGTAITDSNIKLSVTRFNDEIRVFVETEGNSISCNNMSIISSGSVIINNCSFGSDSGLALDVQIPDTVLEQLYIEGRNADMDLKSTVNAKNITIDTKNGNIDVSAIFRNLNIDCKNGNVDVESEARSDVRLNIASKNGNVDVSLENIGTSKVSVDSKNGNCKNNPRLRGKYTVSGYITSKNGNAKFC